MGPEPFQSKFDLRYMLSFLKGKKKYKNFYLIKISYQELVIFMQRNFIFKQNKTKQKAYLIKQKECIKILSNAKKVLKDAIKTRWLKH